MLSPEGAALLEQLAGIDGLDATGGLRMVGGHAPLYRRALLRFVEYYSLPGHAPSIGMSPDQLLHTVHSLRGATSAVGAWGVTRIAQEVEAHLTAQRPGSTIMGPLLELNQAIETLLSELRTRLAPTDQP